ncbi:DUF423 domain-containing protein [Anatilimnocola floriformis]|uniref:DUF423 domain-containing protein n=1 Tax=Anatilimnocola floriformis TaxID=2948575 RepID=UPI0020C49339|nr:DUF423 domain-containing protein [Anatilimnocola floriformis]
MSSKKMLMVGALLGALSVTLGAFGAHGMPDYLKSQGRDESLVQKRLGDWEVASRYLMYHALAVVGCGLLAQSRPSRSLNIACWFFILGTLVFSGFLYTLVLTEKRVLGAIVPFGGVQMIIGWLALAYAGGGYCSAECKKPM